MAAKKTKVEEVPLHEREVLTSELGAVIGKTPQWIGQLTREGILKKVARGKYILGEAVQAYIEHVEDGRTEGDRSRLQDERAELTRIKKEIADLELRKLRGELHSAKDVELLVSDMILTTKAQLQVIPSKLAARLENESAATIEREIRREINAALESLANHKPKLEEGSS